MKNKYFNNAIIGNKNMVASFSEKGELLRLFYPQSDYKQFVDFLDVGMKINDSGIIYLHEDINNTYNQYYSKDTNVLNTEIENSYFKIKVTQTDFVPNKENVLVKRYVFENKHNIDLNVSLLLHSGLLTNSNNQVSGAYKEEALMQYTHDYTVAIFSKETPSSFQINNVKENIESGEIGGKDYVGMSNDSAISYSLGILKPGEKKNLDICIYICENSKNLELIQKLEEIRKMDMKVELDNTKKYWRKFVKAHTKIEIDENKNEYYEKLYKIYARTILLYPLIVNEETGGISAAIEVDEDRTKCGRYSYCWPRDAVSITEAFDILGMEKFTEKFYKNFCKNTQGKDGMWEQRFYTDGTLAPCWGYQVDETASVVYGVYNHYLITKDDKFVKDNLKMCEKAVHFLERYVEDLIEGENKFQYSYDIWEESESVHAYSLAAIFAAFEAILKMYEIVKPMYEENRLKLEQIAKANRRLDKKLRQIKEYIIKNMYDEERKTFVRSLKDSKMDISLLGLVYPFKVFKATEKNISNTVERMNLTLRTYTGGYLRYEGDSYIGGNPWVIATLWLANYYLDKGERAEAKKCLDFVVKTATPHGYLAEQIDNNTLKPAWVIGLGWSHAMFVITLNRLLGDVS
ncbi:MAG: hypothetical protein IJ223_06330 [Clostridia bacterium]|nr:hypothetical protein [Clostridia bacterium]